MKKIVFSFVLVSLLVLISPSSTSAQRGNARAEEFCTSQSDRYQSITDKFSERTDAYNKAVDSQNQRQSARRESADKALERAREKADRRRAESLRLLEEKQTSDEDKARVKSFGEEVLAAVNTRRQAYDAARLQFRQIVDELLNTRDQNMRQALSNFQSSTRLALDSASNRCNGTFDRTQTRADMIAQLKEARLAYGEKLRTRQDFGQAVRDAVSARQAAFRQATDVFQQTMQSIREKYSDL